jgi:hypothetical protein
MKRLRGETDAFNAGIIEGIPRADLERTSKAPLAIKCNLLVMAGNGETAESDEREWEEEQSAQRNRKEDDPVSAQRLTP